MSYVLLGLFGGSDDSDDSDASDNEPDRALGDGKKETGSNSDPGNDSSNSNININNTNDNDKAIVNGRSDSSSSSSSSDGKAADNAQEHANGREPAASEEQHNGWHEETLDAGKVLDELAHAQSMPTLREDVDATDDGGHVLHIPLQLQEEFTLPQSVAVPSVASNHPFLMEPHSSSLLLHPSDLLSAADHYPPLPPIQSAKRSRLQAASASASASASAKESDPAQPSHSVWFATRIRFFDGPVYQASVPDPSSRECTVVAITRYSPTKMLTAGRAYIVPRTFLPTSCMPMADSQGFMPIVMLSTRDVRADNAKSQPWFNILAYTGIINLDCEELNHMQPPAPYLADLSAYPIYTQNPDPYAVSEVVAHLILIDHLTDV